MATKTVKVPEQIDPTDAAVRARADQIRARREADQDRKDLVEARSRLAEELNEPRRLALAVQRLEQSDRWTWLKDTWPEHPLAGRMVGIRHEFNAVRPVGIERPFILKRDGLWYYNRGLVEGRAGRGYADAGHYQVTMNRVFPVAACGGGKPDRVAVEVDGKIIEVDVHPMVGRAEWLEQHGLRLNPKGLPTIETSVNIKAANLLCDFLEAARYEAPGRQRDE